MRFVAETFVSIEANLHTFSEATARDQNEGTVLRRDVFLELQQLCKSRHAARRQAQVRLSSSFLAWA